MVTPCSSQWRKRKEAGEEEEREEREREKEKLPTENHCFRFSSLSLSLSRVQAESIYISSTPLLRSPSRSISFSFYFSGLFFHAILLRIYIFLILNRARAIRTKAFATLTLCFSILAPTPRTNGRRFIRYNLESRLEYRKPVCTGGSRFRKAGYLLRDLCSPLFDNSPSFQNI